MGGEGRWDNLRGIIYWTKRELWKNIPTLDAARGKATIQRVQKTLQRVVLQSFLTENFKK